MKTLSNISILTIVFLSILLTSNIHAQKFMSVTSFGGTYYGKLDGRNAKLKFDTYSYNIGLVEWRITLTDLDRNVIMKGSAAASHRNGGSHVLTNITLRIANGRTVKKFAKIYMHTWNTNYLTAITDQGYGSIFAVNSSNKLPHPSPSVGKRFKNVNDFVGNYVGRMDGRNAQLTIVHTSGKYTITLKDLDRNVTFRHVTPLLSLNFLGQKHKLEKMTLQKVGGRGSKTIGGLYMHTWNTNYISGYTIWSGKEYGNFFVRQDSATNPRLQPQSRRRGVSIR